MGCGGGHDRNVLHGATNICTIYLRSKDTRRKLALSLGPSSKSETRGGDGMSAMISAIELCPLSVIAERLHFMGPDRERSVRRLFERHRVSIIKRGPGVYFATAAQYAELIEKMTTCSQSGVEAKTSISVARSVSGGKRASSKSILAERIAATTLTPTDRSSKRKSATKSFTVVEGGHTP
jgi:hypothetical protein